MTLDYPKVYCRWAEKQYGLSDVTKVEFEADDDGPISEITPGEGAYVRVVITYGSNSRRVEKKEWWVTDLINSILEVAKETNP